MIIPLLGFFCKVYSLHTDALSLVNASLRPASVIISARQDHLLTKMTILCRLTISFSRNQPRKVILPNHKSGDVEEDVAFMNLIEIRSQMSEQEGGYAALNMHRMMLMPP